MVVQGGRIVADRSATLPGRGAWVHLSTDCVDVALTRKAFGRALRNPSAAIDEAVLRQAVHMSSKQPSGTPPGTPERTG